MEELRSVIDVLEILLLVVLLAVTPQKPFVALNS